MAPFKNQYIKRTGICGEEQTGWKGKLKTVGEPDEQVSSDEKATELPNCPSHFSFLADDGRHSTAGLFITVNLKACVREICCIYWSPYKELTSLFCKKFGVGLDEIFKELIFEEFVF